MAAQLATLKQGSPKCRMPIRLEAYEQRERRWRTFSTVFFVEIKGPRRLGRHPANVHAKLLLWFSLHLLSRETPCKGLEKFQRALDANFSSENGPQDISFLSQESQPGFAIRSYMHIGLAFVPFLDLQNFITNSHGGFSWFFPCEGEVIRGLEFLCLVSLKHQWQPV